MPMPPPPLAALAMPVAAHPPTWKMRDEKELRGVRVVRQVMLQALQVDVHVQRQAAIVR
jgi:hypothetical protein